MIIQDGIKQEWEKALDEIAQIILSRREEITKRDILRIKMEVARKYRLQRIPKNSEILSKIKDKKVRKLLIIKPARSLSGIAVIAAMSRPMPCPPQANCIYCPGGVKVDTPQSYTGKEPAARRGMEHDYDSFKQVTARIRQLEAIGHPTSKIELIIMGGTFLSFPITYQEEFVKGCYDALNGFKASSLEEAIRHNEIAERRCVGLTFETRPDFCKEEHVDRMLYYGGTRVEIGVQTLDDDVLRKVRRGHTVRDTIEAFRIAKDAGFKIVAHMMPGLPYSDLKKDYESFFKLFYDDRFKPDMIKIYPTLVVESAPLYQMYKRGEYVPPSLDEIVDLIARVKMIIPPWIRIMRIQRDIPADQIVAGVKAGNLRELVKRRVEELGGRCRCIRCREVGLRGLTPERLKEFRLVRRDYRASEGVEVFLSWENEDEVIAGFLRMRIPSKKAHRPEINDGTAIVRELRVYGQLVDVGDRLEEGWQHRGLGAKLMRKAEEIALSEFGKEKLTVISAVGTRKYYEKLGYYRDGAYMSKKLGRI